MDYQGSREELLEKIKSNPKTGLSSSEAQALSLIHI